MTSNRIKKTIALLSLLAVTRVAAFEHPPMSSTADHDTVEFVQDAQGPIGSGGSKLVCILCMAGGLVAGAGSIAGLFFLALTAPGPVVACGAACYAAFS